MLIKLHFCDFIAVLNKTFGCEFLSIFGEKGGGHVSTKFIEMALVITKPAAGPRSISTLSLSFLYVFVTKHLPQIDLPRTRQFFP